MDRIVGIDPGLSGALCIFTMHEKILTPSSITFEPFPTIQKEIDFQKLSHIFSQLEGATIFLEKVHAMPGQGVCSMFSFGRSYGAMQAMINAYSLSYQEVTPQAWQKELFQGMPVLSKNNTTKKDTKAMAAVAAQRLFPNLEISKSKKAFHDALLIAEYGRRKIFQSLMPNTFNLDAAREIKKT